MKAATEWESKNHRTIAQVLKTRYGTDDLVCDAVAIEWAADYVANVMGVEVAAKQWRRINGRRNARGLYTAAPQWGTRLHAAYFAKKEGTR